MPMSHNGDVPIMPIKAQMKSKILLIIWYIIDLIILEARDYSPSSILNSATNAL